MAIDKKMRDKLPPRITPVVDEAVESALGKSGAMSMAEKVEKAKKMTPSQRKKKARDAARNKETYDLPLDVTEALNQIMDKYWTGADPREPFSRSSLASLLLVAGLQALLDGRVQIEPFLQISRSPRFQFSLDVPPAPDVEDWQPS